MMVRHPNIARWLGPVAVLMLGFSLLGCYGGNHGGYYGRPPATYYTAAVAGADVNGDGKVDLLGANQAGFGASGFVSVRLQDPSQPGGLQAPLRSSAGTNPASLAVGSLGGSALPGVVVVNQQAQSSINPANTVSVLLPGTQPGTFLAPIALPVGARNPVDAALGALTTSGLSDVAVAAEGGSDLLVFFQGPAPGAFAAPVSLAVGGEPSAVAMGDLNGDGLPDLVVATAGGVLSVLVQDPAHPGSFLPHVDYPVGSNPISVKVASLTPGALPDIVTANFGTDLAPTTLGLSVLLHDPAHPGAFLAAATTSTGDYGACSVAVGDLDGDGKPDLAMANYGLPGTPGSVAVFLQDPAHPGAFLSPTLYPGFSGPHWVAIGDFNGDGLPDLAIADGGAEIRFQVPGHPGVFGPAVVYQQ
jgi:hypothetical protein